jgi:hypothetical protein
MKVLRRHSEIQENCTGAAMHQLSNPAPTNELGELRLHLAERAENNRMNG